MTRIDFAAIRTRVQIADVVQWLGLTNEPINDDQLRCGCTACGKSDRDIVVTKSKNAFCCHSVPHVRGKKLGGDAIGLVAHIKGLGQVEAAREIQNVFLASPPTQKAPEESDAKSAVSTAPIVSRDLAIVAEAMTSAQLRKIADTLDAKGYQRVQFI